MQQVKQEKRIQMAFRYRENSKEKRDSVNCLRFYDFTLLIFWALRTISPILGVHNNWFNVILGSQKKSISAKNVVTSEF